MTRQPIILLLTLYEKYFYEKDIPIHIIPLQKEKLL